MSGEPRVAPYGTWASPLSAADVASATLRLSEVALDGADIYWLEGRPQEAGRCVLVRRRAGAGGASDVTPHSVNVRSRVHEYGGGAWVVCNGIAYFVNDADRRVYRLGVRLEEPGRPGLEALTLPGPWRYADLQVDAPRRRLICVREEHAAPGREPVNTLIAIDWAAPTDPKAVRVLASGEDFYASPRLSPDGSTLAWLSWRHPSMPWDDTELWVAGVDDTGGLTDPVRVAGGTGESICQPGWSPAGDLYFVSDRDGWWRIYRAGPPSPGTTAASRPVLVDPPGDTEFGRPQWTFGTATWAWAGPTRLVVSFTCRGRWRLGVVDVDAGTLAELAPELQPGEWLAAGAGRAVLVAGFDARPDAVVSVDLATGAVEMLREASPLRMDGVCVSVAEPIEFPTSNGETAHASYYPPRNPSFSAPAGETPPLIVVSHGGPTTAARCTFNPAIQYWTSRGFAVADVNYRGSSGYGRAYRERLRGAWGVVDVDDAVSVAGCFVDAGLADPTRLIIRGGSAGGYTALAALAFRPGVFAAGSSYYGICDLELLARDTHKFESRYLDSLIGPYPEARAVYRARSPLHAADRVASALILFQGLDDPVVPPSQSALMADAVRQKGRPVAYLAFEGEQHGFRRTETIVHCLEAELYFFGILFGLAPADDLPAIPIENLPPPDR